jgi:hypothetical protein
LWSTHGQMIGRRARGNGAARFCAKIGGNNLKSSPAA